MRIQIDTDKKTVQILGNVKFEELIRALKNMLGGDYKEYLLINEQISYPYQPWIEPIIIPYIPYMPPTNPWEWPTITCNTGTYNIELQDNTITS